MKIFFLGCLLAAGSVGVAAARNSTRGEGWEFAFDLIYQDSTDLSSTAAPPHRSTPAGASRVGAAYRFEVGFGIDWQNIDYEANLQSAILPTLRIVGVSGDLEALTPRAWLNFKSCRARSRRI